ncbi:MAG: BglG family transcription antiterminator [Enterococcus sp.]
MYLSTREKQLINELLHSSTPVTIDRMMTILKVSKRTVYRELDQLDLSLKVFDAQLKKVARGTFLIDATAEAKQSLLVKINDEIGEELSTVERQHAILLEILLTDQPLSLAHFLEIYLVSNTTFYADIKQLEASIEHLPLHIVRNQGYEIIGPEKYRRLLAANVLELEINEYELFHLLKEQRSQNYFFQFVQLDNFFLVREIISEELIGKKNELSDRKLAHLILFLTLTIDRVKKNQFLTNETYLGLANKEFLQIAKHLFAIVGKESRQLYPVNEIVFFASLLNDLSNSFEKDFFDEYFDTQLAYLVKQLITLVSEETDVHFYEDESLYKMLLTHLSGVFSRAVLQEETLTNPTLEKIMIQYEELTDAIRSVVGRIFQEKQLSNEEIAYMVLHFASSLERSPKESSIRIAALSPSGLASTSMLEMRLKRYFPSITQLEFYRIADIKKVNLQEKYDIVISTSILPGYTENYLLVSPLLLEDEIKQLKKAFQKIRTTSLHISKTQAMQEPRLVDQYEQTLVVMEKINQLLSYFFLQEINNETELSVILQQMISCLPINLLTNAKNVQTRLMHRYRQAPVGIPNTNMGLFHTSSESVAVPIFCIFQLNQPIMIEGMDKQLIQLERMLLMLAPSPIEEIDNRLLGKISAAIIMNDLNLEIFQSGNQAIIYQLLAKILIDEMKK